MRAYPVIEVVLTATVIRIDSNYIHNHWLRLPQLKTIHFLPVP